MLNSFWGRAYRRVRDEFFPALHPFDRRTGTDTSGRISLSRLGIDSSSRKYGRAYQGVEPGRFFDALGEIPEDLSIYTFVDLGAGKGRAMMMAEELHFSRLIGVEFSARLAEIARRNLTKLKVRNAEIVVQDAAEFLFPPEPLVVFTFNSFGPEILKSVLRKLRSHPGPLYFVYVNALHDATIREDMTLCPLVEGAACSKFHSVWYRGGLGPGEARVKS
jgi:hypothetical protein